MHLAELGRGEGEEGAGRGGSVTVARLQSVLQSEFWLVLVLVHPFYIAGSAAGKF